MVPFSGSEKEKKNNNGTHWETGMDKFLSCTFWRYKCSKTNLGITFLFSKHLAAKPNALIFALHLKKLFGIKPIYIKAMISSNILFASFPENKNLTLWITQFLCHDTEVPTAFQFHQKWKSPLCFCKTALLMAASHLIKW